MDIVGGCQTEIKSLLFIGPGRAGYPCYCFYNMRTCVQGLTCKSSSNASSMFIYSIQYSGVRLLVIYFNQDIGITNTQFLPKGWNKLERRDARQINLRITTRVLDDVSIFSIDL